MALSGPGGTWLKGSWGGLQLPVIAWSVWVADAAPLHSTTSSWADVPDRVLAVVVFHPGGRKTFMWHVDSYPPPPGESGPEKLGHQVREVNSPEWAALKVMIKAEAQWPPPTT